MDTYSYNPARSSWGGGLLSPLSPNTIESLESRSRDVQERTFCKWYRPSALELGAVINVSLPGSTRN